MWGVGIATTTAVVTFHFIELLQNKWRGRRDTTIVVEVTAVVAVAVVGTVFMFSYTKNIVLIKCMFRLGFKKK